MRVEPTVDTPTPPLVRAGLPRAAEAPLALLGLLAALPVIACAALAVLLTSGRPVFFRHVRVGRNGRPFVFLKLRTMRTCGGLAITAADDARITRVGRVLRQLKVDELPSLWNVVTGELALVGPRPEVPEFVDLRDPRWQRVLSVRPGVTDPVTIALRSEERLLERIGGDRARFYREVWLPRKLAGYLDYQSRRSAASDLGVLARTVVAVLAPRRAPPDAWPSPTESGQGGSSHEIAAA